MEITRGIDVVKKGLVLPILMSLFLNLSAQQQDMLNHIRHSGKKINEKAYMLPSGLHCIVKNNGYIVRLLKEGEREQMVYDYDHKKRVIKDFDEKKGIRVDTKKNPLDVLK